MADLLFYLLALGALAFGAGVVAARSPLFSVLALLGVFVCLSVIYLLAGFQFLAVTQVLVYAGAIMVLFLFVVMLLNLADVSAEPTPLAAAPRRRLALAALAAGTLALVGVFAPGFGQAAPAAPAASAPAAVHGIDRLEPLAEALFTRYVLPFEASSLLLLATMVAVIALAKRQRAPSRDERDEREAPEIREAGR